MGEMLHRDPCSSKKTKSFCSVLLFLINTPTKKKRKKKNPTRLQHLFLFPQSLGLQRLSQFCCRPVSEASGRKEERREETASVGVELQLRASCFPLRLCTFINLPRGRLSARRSAFLGTLRFEGAISSWQSAALSCATDISSESSLGGGGGT